MSRDRYELAKLIATQSRNDMLTWKTAADHARTDFNALLEKYHELRTAGAVIPAQGLKPEVMPSSPSDRAIEQVVERFGGNPRLRRKLQQFQADARRRDADEGEIADNILNWRDPDQEDAA